MINSIESLLFSYGFRCRLFLYQLGSRQAFSQYAVGLFVICVCKTNKKRAKYRAGFCDCSRIRERLQRIMAVRAFPSQDYTLSVRDLFQEGLATVGTENLFLFRLFTGHQRVEKVWS